MQASRTELVDVGGHERLGEFVGVDIPAGGEQQPVVAHDPDVLQLKLAGVAGPDAPALRVLVDVGHPLAILGGGEHVRPEVVAVGVGAHPVLQVQPQALCVGVRRLFARIRSGATAKEEADLTPREKEILASFSQGMSYNAIAEAREVKPATIRNAIYTIQVKLGLGTKQEIVVWAVRNDLLDGWPRGPL